MNYIVWENQQPYSTDGNNTGFLSIDAFFVTGNTATRFDMAQHATGNINGYLDLASGSVTTLTGDSSRHFSYAAFSPELISDLEAKASDGEILPTTYGSSNFNMQFAAVPEPSSVIFFLIGAAFFLKNARFLNRRVLAFAKTKRY